MIARLLAPIRRKGGVANLGRIAWQTARQRAFSAIYARWLRWRGVRVGSGCRFRGRIVVHGDPRRVTIGPGSSLHPGVTFWTHDYGAGLGAIVLGRNVTCLQGVTFNSMAKIEVGDDSAFGAHCYVQDNDHGTDPGTPVMRQPSRARPIAIGRDVWLGARCVVLEGVAIGDRAIVGAGSVVTRSLPGDMVAVGVPCRAIKPRTALPRVA